MNQPPIVLPEAWSGARPALLTEVEALTRQGNAVDAQHRRLPMVKVTRDYVLTSRGGRRRLLGLFASRQQLSVYHFMFDPSWDAGWPLWTAYEGDLGDLTMLHVCHTAFAILSRASAAKLKAGRRTLSRGSDAQWAAGGGGSLATRLAAAGHPRIAAPAEPGVYPPMRHRASVAHPTR